MQFKFDCGPVYTWSHRSVVYMPQDSNPSASCSNTQNSLLPEKFCLIYHHNYRLHTTLPLLIWPIVIPAQTLHITFHMASLVADKRRAYTDYLVPRKERSTRIITYITWFALLWRHA